MARSKRTLSDKVAVVTGASAGVGRAIARTLAREGAMLGLLARGIDGLKGAVEEAKELGTRAIAIPTDMADPKAVAAAAEKIERALGPIDIWVNNAMATVFGPFMQVTPEEFKRVTEVTYLGYVYGTRAALKSMVPRNSGSIIQIGSALAYRSIPLQSAYCGAKHAIKGFTESVRVELLHDKSNVHLTMVELPAVNTPQFNWSRSRMSRRAMPVPPVYQPEIIAEMVLYAATHRRREIWVGLPTIKAIVDERVAPGIGDLYLARTGYDSQQTDEMEDPRRPDNLFGPVPGDHGAHGRFDAIARGYSVQSWLTRHRLGLALLSASVSFISVALASKRAPRAVQRAA